MNFKLATDEASSAGIKFTENGVQKWTDFCGFA